MAEGESFSRALDEWSSLPETNRTAAHEVAVSVPLQLPTYSEAIRLLSDCLGDQMPADRLADLRPILCCLSYPHEAKLQLQTAEILRLTQVPFDNSCEVHVGMLLALYRNLTGANGKRFGSHWEAIGFQGVDPATDLRGVGIFGLSQLFYLSSTGSHQGWMARLYRLSLDPIQQFPFCLVGLNITRVVVDCLRRGKLDGLARQFGSATSVVNQLFAGGFRRFGQLWLEGSRTIADSGTTLSEVENFIRRQSRRALKLSSEKDQTKPKGPVELMVDFTPLQ